MPAHHAAIPVSSNFSCWVVEVTRQDFRRDVTEVCHFAQDVPHAALFFFFSFFFLEWYQSCTLAAQPAQVLLALLLSLLF